MVYVTGGDSFVDVEPRVGAAGLDEHVVKIPAKALGDDGEQTIEVSRSMANSSGIVYLIGYTGTDGELTDARLDEDDSTTFREPAPDFIVKVVFQDPPAAKNDDGDDISFITVSPVARGKTTAIATITVMDENEHAVSGFVNLTIEGADSVLFKDSNLKTHRDELESDGTLMVDIKGLPKTGPFKIKITAEIGELTLTKDIVRTGEAAMVEGRRLRLY